MFRKVDSVYECEKRSNESFCKRNEQPRWVLRKKAYRPLPRGLADTALGSDGWEPCPPVLPPQILQLPRTPTTSSRAILSKMIDYNRLYHKRLFLPKLDKPQYQTTQHLQKIEETLSEQEDFDQDDEKQVGEQQTQNLVDIYGQTNDDDNYDDEDENCDNGNNNIWLLDGGTFLTSYPSRPVSRGRKLIQQTMWTENMARNRWAQLLREADMGLQFVVR
eukprot:TRINITY_DN4809_c0_g1_i1.p3 TRINITY_DN4809_c0_g1~~TRINITY_DN4809_c0_g1_i1.p3  ORF type:complete len:219 (-),score=21.06 TRINITY_DN4809_c0_g1_i1:259-915(-)